MFKLQRLTLWGDWLTLIQSDDLAEVKQAEADWVIQRPYRIIDGDGKEVEYVGERVTIVEGPT